jgi:hypothetical protein
MRSTILNYKWERPLTKLYPLTNSQTGLREHLTFRRPPKTRTLRELRLLCAESRSLRKKMNHSDQRRSTAASPGSYQYLLLVRNK